MLQMNLYQDFQLRAVAYKPDTDRPQVHIDMRDAKQPSWSPLVGYLTMTPEQAWALAHELIAAAARCEKKVGNEARENV